MFGRFKALTTVGDPKTPTKIQDRFKKLTLQAVKRDDPNPEPPEPVRKIQLFDSSSSCDDEPGADRDILLTDDESDEDGSPAGKNREDNKIFIETSNESELPRTDEINSLFKPTPPVEEFSQKLQITDGNISDTVVDSLPESDVQRIIISEGTNETDDSKIRKSIVPIPNPIPSSSDDHVSTSQPIYQSKYFKRQSFVQHSNKNDVINTSVVTLSSESDEIGPDDDTRSSFPPDEVSGIITISSSSESEPEFGADVPSMPVSNIPSNKVDESFYGLNSSVQDRIDRFFDNMPLQTPKVTDGVDSDGLLYVSETDDEENDVVQPKFTTPVIPPVSVPESAKRTSKNLTSSQSTPKIKEDGIKSTPKPKEDGTKSTSSSKSIKYTCNSDGVRTKINISAKFNINIKIKQSESSSGASVDENDDKENSDKSNIPKTPSHSDKHSIQSNRTIQSPVAGPSKPFIPDQSKVYDSYMANSEISTIKDDFAKCDSIYDNDQLSDKNVSDEMHELDAKAQAVLNEIYGDAWKTPQLLRIAKIRMSMGAEDFNKFREDVPSNLESTRISFKPPEIATSPEFKLPKRAITTSRRNIRPNNRNLTPTQCETSDSDIEGTSKTDKRQSKEVDLNPNERQGRVKRKFVKPKPFAICDIDTESSKSDEDYQPSSSDKSDDSSKSSPINNKNTTIKNIKKPNRRITYFDLSHQEATEVDSDSLDSLDKIKQFECTPKAQFPLTTPTNKTTKRKLFTPSYDYVELPSEMKVDSDQESSAKIIDEPEIIEDGLIKYQLPPKSFLPAAVRRLLNDTPQKSDDPKKTLDCGTQKSTPKTVRTPKSTPQSVKLRLKLPTKITMDDVRDCKKSFGFLYSLDDKATIKFCHPKALIFRENFKATKEDLCNLLFDLYNEHVFEFALNEVSVIWNKKLLNTAGRCSSKRKLNIYSCVIELSDKVITQASRLRSTLIHEMCHAAAWNVNHATGHGSEWKKWTQKAMKVFPELPVIKVCHDYEIEYKYTYKCTQCDKKSGAHSRSKKVENIRCAHCHGSIEVFLNKKDKNGDIIMVPTRKATGFAKFVKEKYQEYRSPQLGHADVMKVLSKEFAAMDVNKKKEY